MHRERLETAKKFLLEVLQPLWDEHGSKKFDMRLWITAKDEDIEGILEQGHLTTGCGSAGCFVGWLPTIFPGEFEIIRSPRVEINRFYISRNNFYNECAAADFFDLSYRKAVFLAMPGWYNKYEIEPKHVAQHIDWISEGKNPISLGTSTGIYSN